MIFYFHLNRIQNHRFNFSIKKYVAKHKKGGLIFYVFDPDFRANLAQFIQFISLLNREPFFHKTSMLMRKYVENYLMFHSINDNKACLKGLRTHFDDNTIKKTF